LTGDKGLVGGLWHGLVNAFLENDKRYGPVIVIGVKGENHLTEENVQILKFFAGISDIPQKEEIEHITDYIFNEFRKGALARVDILYPRFMSLAEQRPLVIPFLPFEFTPLKIDDHDGRNISKGSELTEDKGRGTGIPIFEPSKRKIFDRLLRKYIGIFFHKIVMETKLSELSARTVAMEHASSKTNEFVQKIIFDYMKERHRAVTQKQLESFVVHKII
jgi:F-type H+-transporting ATPase subunit gamma